MSCINELKDWFVNLINLTIRQTENFNTQIQKVLIIRRTVIRTRICYSDKSLFDFVIVRSEQVFPSSMHFFNLKMKDSLRDLFTSSYIGLLNIQILPPQWLIFDLHLLTVSHLTFPLPCISSGCNESIPGLCMPFQPRNLKVKSCSCSFINLLDLYYVDHFGNTFLCRIFVYWFCWHWN